ncbi:7-keto-8-aminopelargonate synthetase-like enzyme [Pedobacter psychrotolerans]|uniref:7-keto-8-aminopelargonate synthetase-like enzyme n=1 Tax=Pedobacter psychrotolerans TaxID=1843235 RepID=A0A4R2HFW0_9SPHI|nr:aminotransferase class I/II-fold pyridoxal phosphate-dependent enzyme [Pedobacter psychrotolerans]TCO26917.1 7-keto-8-aminopelargonate synthetase-like enzyme [Pedobacter psychrotolerans]GGE57503.1 8-amino-7-oxononanoate synthase [Pedobacter psychrotolerans]
MNQKFRSINQALSNEMTIDGEKYLYFGGTAYLGIPQNQAFTELYLEGLKRFGLNNGTSRSNNIQLGIYQEAENVAAARYMAQDGLITSSGYLAAQLTVKQLSAFGHVIYAPNTHPSLWINEKPATSGSFTNWSKEILQFINTSAEKNWVLISNSMNNLVPEVYDFSFLNDIDPENNIILIVDDSHGIGINNQGLSALSALPKKKNINSVVVASMAKALGIDAGLVLGTEKMISELKSTSMFVGASPPAAAGMFAFIHAQQIYQSEWSKLQHNINRFTQSLHHQWKFEPGFPAFLADTPGIDQHLLNQQILISSFPYLNPNSMPINRVILCSWHQPSDIDHLVNTINTFS